MPCKLKFLDLTVALFLFFFPAENSPLSSLQYSDGMGAVSLSPSSDPGLYKRMSYSEISLSKGSSRIPVPPEPSYPGFNSSSNPRMKSRSHHNLGQLPESPEHRMVPFSSQLQSSMTRSQVLASTHQRASSDTDSIAVARQREGWETRVNIIYKTNDILVLFTDCLVVCYILISSLTSPHF